MKEFEHIKKVTMETKGGREYERHFWKLDGDIATYMEMNQSMNRKEIASMQDLLDERIVGFSFGKKCREGEDPIYIFLMDDKSSEKFTHSELMESFKDLSSADREQAIELVVRPPFKMGRNMYRMTTSLSDRESKTGRRLK